MQSSRRELLRTGVLAGAAVVTGCVGRPGGSSFEEGFEDGIGDWEAGAAIGPEVVLEEFDWELEVSGEQAHEGARSLRIWNEGDHDDGVTWGTHPVPVEAGRAYDVAVSAQFWSESESFNTLRDAVMQLGPEPPETEADFPESGENTTDRGVTPCGGLREPLWLTEGWREYAFEWTTPELATDTLHVAVGTSVVWESDVAHFVDAVTVELAPR